MNTRAIAIVVAGWITTTVFAGQEVFKTQTVDSQEKAGSVHVAVIGVTPWEEVMQDLQPKFKLTEAEALNSTIPTTLRYYNEAISAWKMALKVALPGSSTSMEDTTTTISGESVTSTTSTNKAVRKKVPGDLSSLEPPEPFDPGLTIKDPNLTETNLGLDAFTRYQAAKTLYQEITILNRMIKDAPSKDQYVPYLLNLQISLIPYSRDLPYDAYSSIALFSGGKTVSKIPTWKALQQSLENHVNKLNRSGERDLNNITDNLEALKFLDQIRNEITGSYPNPLILPLLATDTLEAEDDARLLEQIRDLNFALAGMIKGVGLSAGISSLKQSLEAARGRDLNALLTLGRLSENSVLVRLGAMLQSRSHYAMVPRTHHIALLVLVPKAMIDNSLPTLRLVSRTTFRDARTGRELKSRCPQQTVRQFEAIIRNYDPRASFRFSDYEETRNQLLDNVLTNDYGAFKINLANFAGSSKLASYTDVIWLELARLWLGSQYGSAIVELPKVKEPTFPTPTNMMVVCLDDGKTMNLVLRGGKDLKAAKELQTHLFLSKTSTNLFLLPNSIQVSEAGTSIGMTFPSLKPLGLNNRTNENSDLMLKINETNQYSNCWRILAKEEHEEKGPPVSINGINGYLVAAPNVTNLLSFYIEAKEAGYFLRISGPVVLDIEPPSQKVLGTITNSVFPILTSGDVRLRLGNLLPNVPVQLSVVDNKGKPVVISAPIPVATR